MSSYNNKNSTDVANPTSTASSSTAAPTNAKPTKKPTAKPASKPAAKPTATTTTTTTTVSATASSTAAATPVNDAYTNICPDDHACDNDASCVESLLHENKYVCDCHDAYLQTGKVFAGLSCQHVATEYCTTTGELSHVSFCVNQGVCKSKVDATAAHPGCKCPPQYIGEHCQYVAGSAPGEMSYFLDGTTFAARMVHAEEGAGVSPELIVVPILLVTLGVLGFVLYKYRAFSLIKHPLSPHHVDKTKTADENMLEADGSSSLAKTIQLMNPSAHSRRNSTPSFSSTHKAELMDPPDFEDLLEQSDHVQFHMDPTGTATHKLFASDPCLHYSHTMDTSGSGSPTKLSPSSYGSSGNVGLGISSSHSGSSSYGGIGGGCGSIEEKAEDDLSNSPDDFEEFDPNDFSTRGTTVKAGAARFDDPTFT